MASTTTTRRKLLKTLASAPAVFTLPAGANLARQSIICTDKPESWTVDPVTGEPGLTQSCLNSLGVDGGTINLSNG